MKCNLVELRIFCSSRPSIFNKDETVRFFEIQFRTKETKYSQCFIFSSEKTFRLFLAHLRGEVHYTELVAFQDGGYLLYFTGTRGFYFWKGERSGPQVEVIFPGPVLADWLDKNMVEDGQWHTMPEKEIAQTTWDVRPRIRLVFANDAVKAQMLRLKQTPWWPSLRHCIRWEMKAVRNSSNGEIRTLNVMVDLFEDCFYFWMMSADGREREWNGGWIKRELHGERAGQFEYSAHH